MFASTSIEATRANILMAISARSSAGGHCSSVFCFSFHFLLLPRPAPRLALPYGLTFGHVFAFRLYLSCIAIRAMSQTPSQQPPYSDDAFEPTQLSQAAYSQTQNTQAFISSQVEPRRKYCGCFKLVIINH